MSKSTSERRVSKRRSYALSVGCMESQNTYFDASEQTREFELHKNDASIKPVPQQPLLTSSKSEEKKSKKIIRSLILKEVKGPGETWLMNNALTEIVAVGDHVGERSVYINVNNSNT